MFLIINHFQFLAFLNSVVWWLDEVLFFSMLLDEYFGIIQPQIGIKIKMIERTKVKISNRLALFVW